MPKSRKKKTARPITRSTNLRESLHRGPALIRKFHTVQTALKAAIDAGNSDEQRNLELELEALGGIETYQKASIRGQDKRRGGDSSKTLVEWLKRLDLNVLHSDPPSTLLPSDKTTVGKTCRVKTLNDKPLTGKPSAGKMRVLEIGSLSTENYISRYANAKVVRIDLHSQHPDITQQDFLERRVPKSQDEEFEGISCSLVLNFVPASQRSQFLLHLTHFLPVSDAQTTRWLFFVMPAPCITNSRYMDKALLLRIFAVLGFSVLEEKITDRIAYWLFKRVAGIKTGETFKKQELQTGAARNNFFIALQT